MKEIIGNYYGLDWVAMVISILFLFLIGNKKRYAFIVYLLGNVAWMGVNVMAEIWPGIILNVILVFLNIRAYMKWEDDD